MKTMILATAAVLSLSVGVAFADGGEGPAANTEFTLLPGVIAQAPVQSSSAFAQGRQAGQTTMSFVTRSETVTRNQNEGAGG
jgi:hypothetical protein